MQKDPINSAIDELAADIEKAKSLMEGEDSQFHRRVYVRALFAYLEGVAYWMRQNAIHIDEIILRKGGTIDWERHILLHEEFPTIASSGEIDKQRHKSSFKNRFAFTVRAYAAIVRCKDDLFGNGWQQLLSAVQVRDRLMHPKQGHAVTVSNEDVKLCKEGYAWFAGLMITKFREAAKAMIKDG